MAPRILARRIATAVVIACASPLGGGPPAPSTSSAPAESAPGRDALRVMTFNIRYGTADDHEDRWTNRRDLVFHVMREARPDVLGLQEALRFQIDEIRAAMPDYGELGVGRDDGRTRGEYSAILYRRTRLEPLDTGTFWFSDTPDRPGSITWGNACTRICTWSRFRDREARNHFYVFNLHLDHVSQRSRDKSVDLLLQRIADRPHADPVIITGDFNAGEDNAAIRHITAPGPGETPLGLPRFVDSFRVRHSDAKHVATFHGFKGARHGDRIDYIFTPPLAAILDADIVRTARAGRYPSDHFPVTAVLTLPPSPQPRAGH